MIGSDLAARAVVVALMVPLLLAAALIVHALRSLAARLAPWAALPALVLGLAGWDGGGIAVSWSLLGMQLAVPDRLAQGFLAFTALLWLFAGWFARTYVADSPHRHAFWLFFLVTMSGNIGVVLAQDVASFYVFFALMTFAAYGLILHERSDAARRAGRIYLAMALVGEMLLLTGLLLIVDEHVDLPLRDVPQVVAYAPRRDLIMGLVFAGFGVKAGAVPLHVWLPLAHPVAPTPASAVLSGAMIKAGLLGWLRFLPLGAVSLPAEGLACVSIGFFGALYGSAVGVTQTEPKTVLAYSSVSQMGFATSTLGVGLLAPDAAEAAKAAILLFAMQHAVAKSSLFLGTTVAKETGAGWPARLVTLGVLWPALAIAGAPLSTGALAKLAMKDVMAMWAPPRTEVAPFAGTVFGVLLSVAAVGSTLLMIRFVSLTVPRPGTAAGAPSASLWLPWVLLTTTGTLLVAAPAFRSEPLYRLVQPESLWSAAWPVLTGLGLAALASYVSRLRSRPLPVIPAGDVVVLVESTASHLDAKLGSARELTRHSKGRVRTWARHLRWLEEWRSAPRPSLDRIEECLGGFTPIGALILVLVALLAVLLLG